LNWLKFRVEEWCDDFFRQDFLEQAFLATIFNVEGRFCYQILSISYTGVQKWENNNLLPNNWNNIRQRDS